MTPVPFNVDKYVPPELAARLAAQAEEGLLGERRIVTMLFCDLKGSTAAAEQLDPEAWTEILNGAFEHMIRPVHQYEGTVARLMGDAILAFFGAPIAHEDDPQRAVLAALEIQERIRAYRGEVQAAHGIDIETRIGINTGLVVAGEIGSDQRLEYTAVGDAINLAARMEQTALPGTIQIAAATQRLVDPFFDVEALGEIEVKGKAQPVRAYRVLGIRQTPGQRRGFGTRPAKLVGREGEVARLEQAVRDLAPADQPAASRGAVFLIEGEAGLGKTTLVAEVQRKSAASSIRWLSGTALAYRQSTSYYPWREIFRQSLEAPLAAQSSELQPRLERFAEAHALTAETAAFLGVLLGLEPVPGAELIAAYQGEELVLRLTRAVQEYLETLARETALVLVFDDLQWADEASLSLLAAVTDLVAYHPILLICLVRPDPETPYAPYFSQIRQHAGQLFWQIVLVPLDGAETAQLAAQILATPGLPEVLKPLILSKADGNPLFVEELIRSLQENGQLVRENERWQLAQPLAEIALPEALNSLLSARVDRLPEKTRRVLQMASVFGSAFDVRHLQALLSSENLDAHLNQLQQAGMVDSGDTQYLYSFHHSLMQEAAYQSLLQKDRRRLHARVGELLERFYAGQLIEFAPVLALHFYTAGDPRSIQYDALAGDTAARLYANRDAAWHYRRALKTAWLADVGPAEKNLAEIESLVLRLGQVLELDGRHAEALAEYIKMEELALARGAPATVVRMLMAQATLYATLTPLHDPALGEQKLAQALTLAQQIGDPGLQARLHWNLMINALFSNRLAQAVAHGEPAVQQARQAAEPGQLALSLSDIGRVYTAVGEYARAQAALAEARGLWQAMDHQVMLADNLGAAAAAYYFAGEYDQALAAAGQALQLSQEVGNLWGQSYSYLTQGYIYLDQGKPDRAIQAMSRCIDLGDQGGLLASSIAVRADLAWVYGAFGDAPRGLALARQALAIAEADQPDWSALPAAVLARLHLLTGQLDAAQAIAAAVPLESVPLPFIHYDLLLGAARAELALASGQHTEALDILEQLLTALPVELRAGLPQLLLLKAGVLLKLEQPAAAIETLLAAREAALAIGARHPLWQILAQLAGLAARGGQRAEARRLLAEAQAIVKDIAGRLEAAGLRATFLASTSVQAMWQAGPASSEANG